MSGAAGALAPLASANRLPGIMSALTQLPVTAPAVPSVPQGPSDEAASGFQSLLAAISGQDVAVPADKAISGGGGVPTTKLDIADTATVDDAKLDVPTVVSFLVAPVPAPVPLVLPVAEPADGGATSNGGLGGPATAKGEDVDPGGPNITPLAPTDKSSTPKTNDPQVQPIVAGSTGPLRPSTPVQPAQPVQPTLVETAAITEAVQARAATGAAPQPQVTTPPSPLALRPLAERTSRPLDAATARAGDGLRAAEAATPAFTATATAAAARAAVAPPTGPAEFIAAVAARETTSEGDAEAPASDLSLPGEAGTLQSQTPSATREVAVSHLSRATVEATAQIAAQILRRLEGRSTRFEMALTPDELGRVDVKLDIDSEGRLNARLAFDNPAAATDLRGRADELRRQLEDAGFHLAEDAFEFADRDSGSSAFDRGQDARNGSSRAFSAASRLNDEIDVAQPPRWLALSLSPSGVDMKV